MKIPLRELRLWCPAWNFKAPLTGFSYENRSARGVNCVFDIDLDTDVFTGENTNQHVPIACSTLRVADSDSVVASWSVIDKDRVQVNFKGQVGYVVLYYTVDELYIEGEGYNLEDD